MKNEAVLVWWIFVKCSEVQLCHKLVLQAAGQSRTTEQHGWVWRTSFSFNSACETHRIIYITSTGHRQHRSPFLRVSGVFVTMATLLTGYESISTLTLMPTSKELHRGRATIQGHFSSGISGGGKSSGHSFWCEKRHEKLRPVRLPNLKQQSWKSMMLPQSPSEIYDCGGKTAKSILTTATLVWENAAVQMHATTTTIKEG